MTDKHDTKRRILSVILSLSICSGLFTPVFADAADIQTEDTVVSEEKTAGEVSEDETVVQDDETAEDEQAPADDITESTDTESDTENVDLPFVPAITWAEWDAENGVLTLKNQLPVTGVNNSLAKQLGIEDTAVKKIIINEKTKANTSAHRMFANMTGLTEISGLTNLDTSNVTDFSSMFVSCESLRSLDVSGFNTANATEFYSMFFGCSSLTSLDVSGFETGNCANFSNMFFGCSSLTSLNLSGIDTSSATSLDMMFRNCSSLKSLDVSGFNTGNCTSFYGMFWGCSSLTSLNVSGFKTGSAQDFDDMFEGCSSLKSLDVSGFNTGSAHSFYSMFENCSSLTSLDVSGFTTSNAQDVRLMFKGCSSLTSLDLSGFDLSNVVTPRLSQVFSNCSSLTSLKLPENFAVISYMELPNAYEVYLGWAKAGTKDIISGDGESAVFTADTAGEYVRVKKITPVSVTVSAKPAKTIYYTGDELDLTGAKLKITYDDKSTEEIDITPEMVSGFDSAKTGTQTITVKYSEKTATFTVTVKALQPTKMTLVSAPDKTDYYLGDELDLTGGALEVTYNSGRTETVPMTAEGVTNSGFNSAKTGKYTVTVKYLGKSVSFSVNVAVDPQNAPVTVGDMGYETLAQAVKSITGSDEYTITVCRELTENSVILPKTPAKITINSKNDGVIKTGSLTANCDLVLNCPVEGTRNGAKTALKAVKTVTIENEAVLGAVTGSKTAELIINNDVSTVSIATFGNVTVADGKTLSVSDKVSAVNSFSGTLKMTAGLAKCTAQITNVDNGTVILTAGAKDTRTGKLILPKVTVSDVAEKLVLRVVDAQGNEIIIPDAQPIANAGSNVDFCGKITVDNATEEHPADKDKIKAFLYNKEIRAEYADALILEGDKTYPNFETLFAHISADTASEGVYNIILNGDHSSDKFVLPTAKHIKSIKISGNNYVLTLPGVSTLSPKYDLELEALTIVNTKNSKPVNLTISAAAGKTITLSGFNCDMLTALKGTKTSHLFIDGDLSVKDVSTFASVTITDETNLYVPNGYSRLHIVPTSILTVSGKISSVERLSGHVWLNNPKNSAATVTNADSCTFILSNGGLNNKNVYVIPKVTIKNINYGHTVNVEVVDENRTPIDLPAAQPVLYTNGNDNFSANVEVQNTVDGKSENIKAFLNGKEYQAYCADMLTLECESSIAGNYPNFELLFAAVAKDTAGGEYTVTLNSDIAPAKFALPAKAGTKLTINGNGNKLTLPGISSITPKYDLALSNIDIINKNTKGTDVYLNVNAGKFNVSLDNVSLSGSFTAAVLDIQGKWNGICSGLNVNVLRTANNMTLWLLNKKSFRINQAVESDGVINIDVVNDNKEEIVFGNGTITIFQSFKGTSADDLYVLNNGGLKPHIVSGKLVVSITVDYRALLIGEVNFVFEKEKDPPTNSSRNAGDVDLMANMLDSVNGPLRNASNGSKYTITKKIDLTDTQILSAIDEAFRDADEEDVSLFFIGTHGNVKNSGRIAGRLSTTDGTTDGYLYLDTLAEKLSQVKGKVIVILGSCGSGAAIYDDTMNNMNYEITEEEAEYNELFNELVVEAFENADPGLEIFDEDQANTGEFRQSKFLVLTAAQYQQLSWGNNGKGYNYFVKWLTDGVGLKGSMPADTNNDRILTLDELYRYISAVGDDHIFKNNGQEYTQQVQVYPLNSDYALFRR